MAGHVSQSTIEQIRAASDIVDVIGSFFPLKRAGGNHVALCPFHKEKTPSFNINPQRQIYHCFGCHAGGDVFKFIQEYENVDFIESVKRLADRAGIRLEFDQNPEAEKSRHIKDTLYNIHERLSQRWHEVLLDDVVGKPARVYLKERGITKEAVKNFRMGFAPPSWEDTVNWAQAQKYDRPLMEQAGLVASKNGHCYGRFRSRLMFPINDEQGRVIGFSGRVLEADSKAAKYVNSPETILFQKGKVFYGLDKARREILSEKSVLICEGQLDTIACHMAGLQHVVAPQGTALTADHARILKRYASEVVLCFDSDTAGQNASVRSFDSLIEAELAVRVMTVPPPHDPDSFIREHGVEAFRDMMDNAPGYFEFFLSHLMIEHDAQSDHGRQGIIREMGISVRKMKDAVLLDRCAQQVALAVGASAESVRAEFQRIPIPRSYRPREAAALPVVAHETDTVGPPSQQEQWLLRLSFYDAALSNWTADCLDTRWVKHSQVRAILERAKESGVAADVLVNELDGNCSRLLTAALASGDDIPDPARQLRDLVSRLRDRYIDGCLSELTRLTAQPNLPEAELLRVLEEQNNLRTQKLEELPLVVLC
ncbi:MAG: DNA primase [Verrucomicrobiota bacterium]|jgi:DNA primase|nr:DNA primase [Verrucomicrobiota bacterium]